MLIDAPFVNGVPSVTVPEDQVELNAPPLGCDGGCTNVVPCTLTVQGVVATPFGSQARCRIPETTTNDDVRERRSAIFPKAPGSSDVNDPVAQPGHVATGVIDHTAPEIKRAEGRVVGRIAREITNAIWRQRRRHRVVQI